MRPLGTRLAISGNQKTRGEGVKPKKQSALIVGGKNMKYILISNLGLVMSLLAFFGKSVWGKSVW